MKYTKEQILTKAKVIMKDHLEKYYTENCIKEDVTYFGKELIEYGKNKGKEMPLWLVSIKSLFDNENLLFISDDTGEPVYYQNFNTYIFDVEKDKEGKYFMKEIEY